MPDMNLYCKPVPPTPVAVSVRMAFTGCGEAGLAARLTLKGEMVKFFAREEISLPVESLASTLNWRVPGEVNVQVAVLLGVKFLRTYVPARNLIFLSYALGYAEVTGADHIFIGVNAVDYSGYPDCRPEFIQLFQQLANYSTKAGVQDQRQIVIETPLLHLSKKDIVLLGNDLHAPLELTTSCYNGEHAACGHCDSCVLRLKGFADAGVADPILYETGSVKI